MFLSCIKALHVLNKSVSSSQNILHVPSIYSTQKRAFAFSLSSPCSTSTTIDFTPSLPTELAISDPQTSSPDRKYSPGYRNLTMTPGTASVTVVPVPSGAASLLPVASRTFVSRPLDFRSRFLAPPPNTTSFFCDWQQLRAEQLHTSLPLLAPSSLSLVQAPLAPLEV